MFNWLGYVSKSYHAFALKIKIKALCIGFMQNSYVEKLRLEIQMGDSCQDWLKYSGA